MAIGHITMRNNPFRRHALRFLAFSAAPLVKRQLGPFRYSFRRHSTTTPPANVIKWHKLNTDGSVRDREGNTAAGGGLLQDDRGRWILGFSCNLGSFTVTEAELRALKIGMVLARERGIKNLLVETDSEPVVRLVNNEAKINHEKEAEVRSLVEDCKGLVRNPVWNCRVVHVKRTGNRCADKLAEHGHGLGKGEERKWKKPPVWMKNVLEIETAG